MKKRNSNVGAEIQTLAILLSILIISTGIIGGILTHSIFGLVLFTCISILLAYIQTLLLRGFGVLVERVVSIDEKLNHDSDNSNP